MVLILVFKSSFKLFNMFTVVKDYVCIVIVSIVSLSSSSATCMAVSSPSITDVFFLVYKCRHHSCPVTLPVGIVRVVVWLRTDVL